MAEHLEPMALRQLGQIGDGFRNEGRGLVRPALPARLIVVAKARPLPEDARFAPLLFLVKNCIQYPCIYEKIPF